MSFKIDKINIDNFVGRINKKYTGNPLGFKSKQLPCDVFVSSQNKVVKKPKSNIFSFLKGRSVSKYSKFLEKIRAEFFQKPRTYEEIEIFEKNYRTYKKLLEVQKDNNTPFFLAYDIQNALLELSKRNVLSEEFLNIPELKSRHFDFLGEIVSGEEISSLYFSQDFACRLDLTEFTLQISERIPTKKDLNEGRLKLLLAEQPKFIDIFRQSKDIDLNSSIFRSYVGDFYYDLPHRFAIAANNQYLKTGNAYIVDTLPLLFDGLKAEEVCKNLDLLSVKLRDITIKPPKGQMFDFNINDKKFKLEYIDSGLEGSVFRIFTREDKLDSVVMKIYKNPSVIGSSECFGSMAIHREATKAGCSDIPKFLIGNPKGIPVSVNEKQSWMGSWQIAEDACRLNTLDNKKSLLSWLDENGLAHFDFREGDELHNPRINGCITDFGYIGTHDIKTADLVDILYSCDYDVNNIFALYDFGYSTDKILEILENIILNTH